MSVTVEDPVLDPAGFLVGYPGEFSWADFPAAGWIGDELAGSLPDEMTTAELLDAVQVWEKLGARVAGNQAKVCSEPESQRGGGGGVPPS